MHDLWAVLFRELLLWHRLIVRVDWLEVWMVLLRLLVPIVEVAVVVEQAIVVQQAVVMILGLSQGSDKRNGEKRTHGG